VWKKSINRVAVFTHVFPLLPSEMTIFSHISTDSTIFYRISTSSIGTTDM
jgi:hypothetical protein